MWLFIRERVFYPVMHALGDKIVHLKQIWYHQIWLFGYIWENFSFWLKIWGTSPSCKACRYHITELNFIKNTRNRQISMSTCGLKKISWENSIGAWRKVPMFFFWKKNHSAGRVWFRSLKEVSLLITRIQKIF